MCLGVDVPFRAGATNLPSWLLSGFIGRDLSDSKLIVLSILLTDLLTTAVDAWRQPWTPRSASELYGPVSWTVMDSPGLAQPPEKRTASPKCRARCVRYGYRDTRRSVKPEGSRLADRCPVPQYRTGPVDHGPAQLCERLVRVPQPVPGLTHDDEGVLYHVLQIRGQTQDEKAHYPRAR
jgi:hypothetical protein